MLFIKEKSHTLTPAGTIGTHSLTVAELPAHTHGRGTTDITGEFSLQNDAYLTHTRCFSGLYSQKRYTQGLTMDNIKQYGGIQLTASNSWSGVSQSIGSGTAHGHSWAGTQVTINHMNPYTVAYCYKRIS